GSNSFINTTSQSQSSKSTSQLNNSNNNPQSAPMPIHQAQRDSGYSNGNNLIGDLSTNHPNKQIRSDCADNHDSPMKIGPGGGNRSTNPGPGSTRLVSSPVLNSPINAQPPDMKSSKDQTLQKDLAQIIQAPICTAELETHTIHAVKDPPHPPPPPPPSQPPQSHSLPLNNSIAGQPASRVMTAPPYQQIQQPPTNANGSKLFDINPNSLPSSMKKEGEDRMMMSNPKVKKVVDVGLVHTLVHNSVVCCVKFLPDGNILAAGYNENTTLYNTMTGSKICSLMDEQSESKVDNYIRSASFSPDGQCFATGSEDQIIEDCKHNTIRSQAKSTLNVPSFLPVCTDVVAVRTTVYDMAHDKPFLNWSSHLPPPETPHKVPLVQSSQKSLTKGDRCNGSASGYNSLNGQSSSSHLSHTTGKSLGINVNGINPCVEIDKLKSQLGIAFSEVEQLETQLKVQDKV
ncbi:hypothetical protein BY996DRAFT_8494483, partial [Phakopsora pachyrhizi]